MKKTLTVYYTTDHEAAVKRELKRIGKKESDFAVIICQQIKKKPPKQEQLELWTSQS